MYWSAPAEAALLLASVRAVPGVAHAVDVLEAKASTVDEIPALARVVPQGIRTYVEIPIEDDPHELVAALAAAKLRAKMRTGGTAPGSIPPPEHVAQLVEDDVAQIFKQARPARVISVSASSTVNSGSVSVRYRAARRAAPSSLPPAATGTSKDEK